MAEVVPKLAEVLSDPNPKVRGACAWSLGTMGPAAEAVRADLERALKDSDPWVRHYANNVLAAFKRFRD